MDHLSEAKTNVDHSWANTAPVSEKFNHTNELQNKLYVAVSLGAAVAPGQYSSNGFSCIRKNIQRKTHIFVKD